MIFNKNELIKATDAKILKDTNNGQNYSISTDTRTICPEDIYLPLKGESFDGEAFIDKALENGAKAYFTTRDYLNVNADFILQVNDTKEAYLKIANYCRKKFNPITIQITGSSGKTTTKELVYSVLSQKFNTVKTFSNHNNEIGFCQTVLSINDDTQALVVESGMRGFGEIELISKYLSPDYAIITNSGSAHVGRLGSLDNIAIAKCEIASGLNSKGACIALNQDIIKKHLNYPGEKIYFSFDDVKIIEKKLSYSKFEYKGNIYELNVDGDYNIQNSLSAIELGLKLGMTPELINKGLLSYKPIEKRWEEEIVSGFKFINDSYNANPESMKASVKTFVDLYQNPVVILGDMGELGESEALYHTQVGDFLSDLNKNVKYITIGELAKNIAKSLKDKGFEVVSFDNNEQAARYIVENLNKSYTIFLKASRSMKLEQIIDYIKRGIN